MIDGLRLAFGTLTALRVPPPQRVDTRVAAVAMTWAPVVTLVVGIPVVVGGTAVAWSALPPPVAAGLVVGALGWVTRGLHLDGLADTADGLASGQDPERGLTVMRRGDVGPAGVAAVAVVVLVDAACLAQLLGSVAGTVAALTAVAASRHTLAWGCRSGMPRARADGLGAAVAQSVSRRRLALGAVTMAAVACAATATSGAGWAVGAATTAAAVGGGLVVQRRARRRLGGITGDVLGASVEVGLAAALVVAATLTG
ncbi:MAG: adenosylcobinamide-GDP ribazoletransferase [Dermatophilaceae bacterium]